MKRDHTGITMGELWAAVAIISTLAAILFPTFNIANEKAKSASCQSNLKQIGLALLMYQQDCAGFPPAVTVSRRRHGPPYRELLPYIKYDTTFTCPNDPRESAKLTTNNIIETPSYGFRTNILGKNPEMDAKIPVVLDATIADGLWDNQPGSQHYLLYTTNPFGETPIYPFLGRLHPGNKLNVLFLDGHVKSFGIRGEIGGECGFPGRMAPGAEFSKEPREIPTPPQLDVVSLLLPGIPPGSTIKITDPNGVVIGQGVVPKATKSPPPVH